MTERDFMREAMGFAARMPPEERSLIAYQIVELIRDLLRRHPCERQGLYPGAGGAADAAGVVGAVVGGCLIRGSFIPGLCVNPIPARARLTNAEPVNILRGG